MIENAKLAGLLGVLLLLGGCASWIERKDTPLSNTYWRAESIDGKALAVAPREREPFLVFSADAGRVRGYAGCNELAGGFEATGGAPFKGLAMTQRGCAAPFADVENSFLTAVNATASLRILRDQLELLDAAGKVRVVLRAGKPAVAGA